MTKKTNPIAEHKYDDITLLRKILLTVIDTAKSDKDRIEAGKLLARLHHALQVDKTKVTATAQQLQGMSGVKLTKQEQERIDKILNE